VTRPQRGVGPRPKIDAKRIQRLLENIASGQYHEVSARMAGVHPVTVNRWIKRGENEIDRAGELLEEGEPEGVITEWLSQFKDDFKADNPMWIIDPPEPFLPNEWIYALFVQRFETAKAVAEVSAVANIRKAARAGNWQADAWFLERTRHERYGRKTVLEHSGVADGAPIKVEAAHSVSGLLERVAQLAEQVKSGEPT
jgi:hypothetical protein